jgi:hypothetical protein
MNRPSGAARRGHENGHVTDAARRRFGAALQDFGYAYDRDDSA